MINVKRKNGFISVVIALLLAVMTVSVICNYNAKADNGSLRYVRYNAKTGAYLGSYTLSSMPENNNSREIFSPDDRVIDWTKSGVVKLMTSDFYVGTGFVVGEHVVATAGHCVADKKLSEILLFNSNGTIAKHATPVESHFLKAYDDAHSTSNDYALITVKEDLSDFMCFKLASPIVNLESRNCVVSVTGFPGEYNNHSNHQMYTGNGVVTSTTDKLLTYNADTTGGNSGGPVYITESYNGQVYYSVVAVHTASGNTGTRMTFDLLHFYMNNSFQNY
ncbi:MAG: trypsin-like serine peptidase [Porcipelethomonas sp.]